MRKDILKLIKLIEKQIVGILIAKGWAKSKEYSFSTLTLTPMGKREINSSDPLITDDWIKQWRNLWPPNMRGQVSVIREKLNNFLMEYNVTLEEITQATEKHLSANQAPYCGKAIYFFLKILPNSPIA